MSTDRQLCLAYLEGDLDAERTAAFERRACSDAALTELLVEIAQDEVSLRDWASGRLKVGGLPARARAWFAGRTRPVLAFCIAAVLLVAVAFLAWPAGDDGVRARLADARDVVWGDGPQYRVGGTLRAGDRIAIESGSVDLVYGNWAEVTLEGPSTYVVGPPTALAAKRDADPEPANAIIAHGWLERGSITVHCPPEATGFVVEGPGVRVVDLGTRFTLDVDAGETRAEVTEGRIRIASLDDNGKIRGSRTLFANEIAVVAGGRIVATASPKLGDPAAHRTRGGMLAVTLAETLVRTRQEAGEDNYAFAPKQVFDRETNETRFALPYGERPALYREVRGLLTSPEIASAKFRSVDPNTDALLEYHVRFDTPITTFRYGDGCSTWTLGPNTEGGVEYSTDGTTWHPIRTINGPHDGSFTPLVDGFEATGLETRDLHLRYFARGVANPGGPVGERSVTVYLTGGSDWCGSAAPFFDHDLEITVTGR